MNETTTASFPNTLNPFRQNAHPTSTILTLLLLTLPTLYALQTLHTYRRLSHIPGPLLNALTPFVITYHCLRGDINTYNQRLVEQYGPLVRVTPTIVMISDAKTLAYVCSNKAGYRRGLFFEFTRWSLERRSSLSMRGNEERKERKGKLGPAFIGPGLALMEQRVDKTIREFVRLVERKYLSTPKEVKPMEFGRRVQLFTLDVVTNVTFGEPFGFLKTDGDVERYIEMNEAMLPLWGILGTMPWLVHVMHAWPINKMMPGDGDKVGFGRLMKFATEAVKKRLEPDSGDSEHDLIRAFLKNGLEPEDVVQECITLVVAGTETTTVAIRMTMLALLTNPPVYAKLQAEIDAYYADKPPDHIISYSDTKSLPYLQAVIREGMRLWPPAAGLMTKEVPKGGDVLHGHFLPEGTEVGQIMVGIGRQPEVWGPDGEVFRPERWFDVDAGKREEMVMASDINFSAGKYLCLGKSVALMEIGKFLAELLRRYDLAAHNAAQPAKVTDPLVWITSDFFVRFTRREGLGQKEQWGICL